MTPTLEILCLYDEAILLLTRRGFDIDREVIKRDWSISHQSNSSVANAWMTIYRNTEPYWDLYELAGKLVDLKDSFQRWRYRHLMAITRIIGHKRGTGGTSGVDYLEKALQYRFFPEPWDVRTEL